MQAHRQPENRLKGFLRPAGGTSRATSRGKPHRVKAATHRHGNRTTGHSVYANDNPVRNTDPDGRQTQGPDGYGFYGRQETWTDTFLGGMFAQAVGDPIAVMRSDNLNPINGRVLNAGEIQNAKYAALATIIPAAKLEATSIEVTESIVAKVGKSVARSTVDVTSRGRTVDKALTTGEKFVGEGAKEVGSGVFRSTNGTRQFRMTDGDITGGHGKIGPHVHFEKFDPDTGRKIKNIHTPLLDQ